MNCSSLALAAAWKLVQPMLHSKCFLTPSETPVLAYGTRACPGLKAMRENATGIWDPEFEGVLLVPEGEIKAGCSFKLLQHLKPNRTIL